MSILPPDALRTSATRGKNLLTKPLLMLRDLLEDEEIVIVKYDSCIANVLSADSVAEHTHLINTTAKETVIYLLAKISPVTAWEMVCNTAIRIKEYAFTSN